MNTAKIWDVAFSHGSSAADLLSAIVEEIRTEYVDFTNELDDAGHLDFYKDQTAFARRLMFFDYLGNTTEPLRKIVKHWLLVNAKNSIAPEDELNVFHRGCYIWRMERCTKVMNDMRDALRRDNPILTNEEVPLALRENFLCQVLKNNKKYQTAMKELDKKIKEIVAKIVSVEINEVNPSTLPTEWRDLYM